LNFLGILFLSSCTGFVALSYEIVWFRAYSLATGSGPASFGVMLGAYLFGIAIGSSLSRRFCVEGRTADPKTLRALAGFVFVANALGFLVIPALAQLCTMNLWGLALPLVAHAAGALGASLPLLAHFSTPADESAGFKVSQIYLANILGSCAGSLVTGSVLFDVWSLKTIALFLAGLGVLLCLTISLFAGLTHRERIQFRVAIALAAVGIAAAAPALFDQVYEKMQFRSEFNAQARFRYVVENRHGVITVSEEGLVYGSGAYDGIVNSQVADDRNRLERTYSVAAVNPNLQHVLMIGLATGAWAQVVAHLPGVEKLTVIEINPGYLELIPRFPAVASLLKNPKVEIIIDDGRRWLRRHPEARFNFIVANTTWHWRAFASNLLSVEYLELARQHLKPGGGILYNTTSSPEVQRTAATVFPYMMRVENFVTVSDSPFEFDRGRWKKALLETRIDGNANFDLQSPADSRRFNELVAMPDSIDAEQEAESFLETRDHVLKRTVGARLVTDDNMICEFAVPM
jgi:spermidine synthase